MVNDAPVNAERVKLLVSALRSGGYRKGLGTLHDMPSNTWCCLGVACDIARKSGVEIDTSVVCGTERFGNTSSDLPAVIRDWYGFTTSNPDLELADGGFTTAVRLNDSVSMYGGESEFTGIADAFERTYLKEDHDGE